MADIVIDRVQKNFGATTALASVSLAVADREFVALLGPSGCGKTTLLRIVAGLETQTSGRVLIGGRDVSALPPRARGLAMVFQNYAVFPHMNVRANIGFGLKMTGADRAHIARQVERTSALLHLENLLDRFPTQLSGGQRQRVAVARALAVEPQVLLMDEPLSNLDALLRLDMRAELKAILREAGTTTLYVTHDQTEAMGLADRIAILEGGHIVQTDRPAELYRHPATRFVGGFIGSPPMNFLLAEAAGGFVSLGSLRLPCPRASGPVLLGMRPEDVAIGEDGIAFELSVIEPMGSHALLTGRVGAQLVRVMAPPDTAARPADMLHLRPDPARIVWMDATTGAAIPE